MRTEWFPLVNEEGETIGKATHKEMSWQEGSCYIP